MNTMQQEFDAVVAHLYAQGKRAAENGRCKYRSNDGTMCAVGCRIPNDMYDSSMEGDTVEQLTTEFNLPEEIYAYREMFKELQLVHDGWIEEGVKHLDESLPDVARHFRLTFTKPQ